MTERVGNIERVYPPKIMFMVANPIMKVLFGTNVGNKINGLVRLDFRGHKSGKRYEIVAAIHDVDGENAVLTNSAWRHNFAGGRDVTVRGLGERRTMTGTLESDPNKVAAVYLQRLNDLGLEAAARRLGIKIHGGEMPTKDELAAFAKEVGLSVIYLTEQR